jgi:VanZ family protein
MGYLGKLWQKPRGALIDVLPVVLYVAGLFWYGLTPLDRLPGPEFKFADKVWHAAVFAGLAAFGSRALRFGGRESSIANRDAALSSATLGGLLEVFQSFTAYRSADVVDFFADALGAALAYALLTRLALAADAMPPPPRPAE